jgi:flagellar protein FlbD
MIELHRIGHGHEPFQLNPDLIVTVEAHPDTVITLATGTKIVVGETPEEVADEVRDWRVSIANAAWRDRRDPISGSNPALV